MQWKDKLLAFDMLGHAEDLCTTMCTAHVRHVYGTCTARVINSYLRSIIEIYIGNTDMP